MGRSITRRVDSSGNDQLQNVWRLADAELELLENEEDNAIDLRTDRIFLDAQTLKAANAPLTALTYIANNLHHGTNATPYSMITGVSSNFLGRITPTGDNMVITEWLANDLQVKSGDQITVDYYVLGLNRQLEERPHTFTVVACWIPSNLAGANCAQLSRHRGCDNLRDWSRHRFRFRSGARSR